MKKIYRIILTYFLIFIFLSGCSEKSLNSELETNKNTDIETNNLMVDEEIETYITIAKSSGIAKYPSNPCCIPEMAENTTPFTKETDSAIHRITLFLMVNMLAIINFVTAYSLQSTG